MMKRVKKFKLRELPVLVLDCQAVGGKPDKGFLLEIGWLRITADAPLDPMRFRKKTKSFLVKGINRNKIPRNVTRLMGIGLDEFEAGIPEKDIWDKFLQAAETSIASTGLKFCPVVIHYSRYEEPFIRNLFEKYGFDGDFPFKIICTHKVISGLFPGLPRKSLRAAAGFFGFSLPDFRRCQEHVIATAYIWCHLVRLLEKEFTIHTLKELNHWMSSYCSNGDGKKCMRDYPLEEKFLKDLPDQPGLYRMYRSNGDLLYIGKAKSLKKRVNSYFRGKGQHAEHILEMLSQARMLTTTTTCTAVEAALRESDEIKYHSPPYNRSLKDQGREIVYFSLDLKKKTSKPGWTFPLGPFPHARFLDPIKQIMDFLNEKNKKITIRSIETVLNLSPEYCPDPICFRQGIDLFREEFFKDRFLDIILTDLKRLGVLFWKEKMEAREELEKEDEEVQESGDIPESTHDNNPSLLSWTPERIIKVLKSIIRTGIFYIRRADWFCRLCESSLVWEADRKENRRLLSVEEGVFQNVVLVAQEGKIPVPSGYKRNRFQRQKCFDIGTYDRMRVLTTEIRRILSEGREVEIRFSPRTALNAEQIKKILLWI